MVYFLLSLPRLKNCEDKSVQEGTRASPWAGADESELLQYIFHQNTVTWSLLQVAPVQLFPLSRACVPKIIHELIE